MDTIIADKGGSRDEDSFGSIEWDGTSINAVDEGTKQQMCDYDAGEIFMTFTHQRIFFVFVLWAMSLLYLIVKIGLEITFGLPYAFSEKFRQKSKDEDDEVFGCASKRAYDVLLTDGILVPAVSAPIFLCTNRVPEVESAPIDWFVISIILDCIPGIALPAYALVGCSIGYRNVVMVVMLAFGCVRFVISVVARVVGVLRERCKDEGEGEEGDADKKPQRRAEEDSDADDGGATSVRCVVVSNSRKLRVKSKMIARSARHNKTTIIPTQTRHQRKRHQRRRTKTK